MRETFTKLSFSVCLMIGLYVCETCHSVYNLPYCDVKSSNVTAVLNYVAPQFCAIKYFSFYLHGLDDVMKVSLQTYCLLRQNTTCFLSYELYILIVYGYCHTQCDIYYHGNYHLYCSNTGMLSQLLYRYILSHL